MLTTIAAAFANPDAWTSGAVARDADGNPVGPCNANAVAWDVQGYLIKLQFEENGTNYSELNEAYRLLTLGIPGKNKDIEFYNDNLGAAAAVVSWVSNSTLPEINFSAIIRDGTNMTGDLTTD